MKRSNNLVPFSNIYHGKKVFVTGHTGFKGSWLVQWLLTMGAEVVGYALPPSTQPNLFDTLNLASHIQHIEGDVQDLNALTKAMQNTQPEVVFHMAAQALVRYSYDHPVETYQTNAMGTVHLLEAVRATPSVRAVVNVTSDKCYENREHLYGYREHDAMGGYDPYSNSKGVAELITAAYRSSYFNPSTWGTSHHVALASARAGNVIGGGDYSADRLIPDCVRALNQGEAIHIRRPDAIRPWQFVLEPLAGYLHLGGKLLSDGTAYAEGWNFGPRDEGTLTVKEVVLQAIESWGNGRVEFDEGSHPHEATLLTLDITKAQRRLGWQPVYTAKEAITHTMAWYHTFHTYRNTSDIQTLTLQQLQQYNAAITYQT
jgi:CDP-glucose 4,6-dehydratase